MAFGRSPPSHRHRRCPVRGHRPQPGDHQLGRNADLYRSIQGVRGHPSGWQVLPLSCFAVTAAWPPDRLAEGTGFGSYRLCRAGVLTSAGYELWPTEVFIDDLPDPRNEVHYDLIVAAGPALIPSDLLADDKAARTAARASLAPRFEAVLELMGDPVPLE